jgi:hypothetical protein
MKHLILYLLITFITCAATAQKGNNQLALMAETGISRTEMGFGGYLKGLYGVIGSGQLTLTAGVSKFRSESNSEHSATTIRLIPVLAGYKKNFSKFYKWGTASWVELSIPTATTPVRLSVPSSGLWVQVTTTGGSIWAFATRGPGGRKVLKGEPGTTGVFITWEFTPALVY